MLSVPVSTEIEWINGLIVASVHWFAERGDVDSNSKTWI
jgi:hypothetical protein